MQAPPTPTEDDDAPIPPEIASNAANMNHTAIILHRKAAKRTLPWDLTAAEQQLVPHIPERKRPRLEEPLPTITDEVARRAATTVLVPGRTQKQCSNRWHDGLDPSIDQATGRTGKWAEDEDI
jgi:hypothetical protein